MDDDEHGDLDAGEELEHDDFDAGEELRNAAQGDMSVDNYCWRLKALANALAELGEPVDDRLLTLRMIRGLSPRFRVMSTALLVHARLPSFMEAFAWLRKEEYDLNHGLDAQCGPHTPRLVADNDSTDRGSR